MKHYNKTLCILFILISLAISPLAAAYTYKLTEAELQEKLDTQTFEHKDSLLKASVTDGKITLLEKDNQILLSAKVDILLLRQIEGQGSAAIQGQIHYEPEKGAFYFKNAKIQTLAIDNLDPEYLPLVQQALEKTLSKTLSRRPIYVLDDKDVKQKLAKSQLDSVEVKDKVLIFNFSIF